MSRRNPLLAVVCASMLAGSSNAGPQSSLELLAPEVERVLLVATAASEDLGTIVGWGQRTPTASAEAFCWTAEGGFQWLVATEPGHELRSAHGVSPDGVWVVGSARTSEGAAPFRWSAATGPRVLGSPDAAADTVAGYDISADGATVVGIRSRRHSKSGFIWTEATDTRVAVPPVTVVDGSGAVAGGLVLLVNGVPFDELGIGVIYGLSLDGESAIAQASNGDLLLLQLEFQDAPTIVDSQPLFRGAGNMLSGDGLRVSGHAEGGPVYWSEDDGFRNIRDELVAHGVSPAALGWTLHGAIGATPDRQYVGNGMHDGAGDVWRATIQYSNCRADMNSDEIVGAIDLAFVLSAWGALDPDTVAEGDANSDGVVDAHDLALVLAEWGVCR